MIEPPPSRCGGVNPRCRGFTLIELVLSITLFILLVTAAFSIVGVTSELMAEVSEVQNESAIRLRFVESCRGAFESTTRQSSLSFYQFDRSSGRADTYLVLGRSPRAFDLGLSDRFDIEYTVLAAETQPSGFIRSRVYYMTLDEYLGAIRENFSSIEVPYVDLIPRLRQIDWSFFNPLNSEWETDFDPPFATSLVKLVFRTEETETPMESTFYYFGTVE